MKAHRILTVLFLPTAAILLFFVAAAAALPSVPAGLKLTPGETTIDASWTANYSFDNVTAYNLYWGTSSDALTNKKTSKTTSCTLSGLTRSTTYYAALTAANSTGESARTDVVSATTLADASPAAPTGLDNTFPIFVGTSSVNLHWSGNTESDMSHYVIYGGMTMGTYSTYGATADTSTSKLVTDLQPSLRYYFAVSAVDKGGNESQKSAHIVVDTLPDSNPPNVPTGVSGTISGFGEATITFNGNNAGMIDLSGYNLYMGAAPAPYGYAVPIDLGPVMGSVQSNLVKDTVYYFQVTAYDRSGNESGPSAEASLLMEDPVGFLSEAGIKEGCFIATVVFGSYDHPAVRLLRQFRDRYLLTNRPGRLFVEYYYRYGPDAARFVGSHPWLKIPVSFILVPVLFFAMFLVKAGIAPLLAAALLLPIALRRSKGAVCGILVLLLFSADRAAALEHEKAHKMGIKGGYFLAAEQKQRDVYEDERMSPIMIFYDYGFTDHFSIEAEAGYIKNGGFAIAPSGQQTSIETEMTIAPVAASIKWSFDLTDYIRPYLGVGGDYWYVRETVGPLEFKGKVGGWHGKIGAVFYNPPNRSFFEGGYEEDLLFILEATRSKIDRFGDNEVDLGGWLFNIGVGYQF